MKNIAKIFSIANAAFILLALSACTGKSEGFIDRIPADEDFVVVGNVKNIIESIGGSVGNEKITVPSFATREMSRMDFDEFEDFLSKIKVSGVNFENMAIAGNYKDDMPVVIVRLDDEKKFKRMLGDDGFDDEDIADGTSFFIKKVKVIYDNGEFYGDYMEYAVAIRGGYAYFTSVSSISGVKARSVIERFIDGAESYPMSKNKIGQSIDKGDALAGVVRMPKELKSPDMDASMLDGYFCFLVKLDGNKLNGTISHLDENGEKADTKSIISYLDCEARLSSKALSYLGRKQQLVSAVSLKNVKWDKILEQVQENFYGSPAMYLSIAQGYLNNIDGTVAIGMGIDGGLDIIDAIDRSGKLSELPITLVIETKPGKAKGIFNDLTDLLDQFGIPYSKSGKSDVSISLPGDMGDYYLKYDGNLLVFSTMPINAYGDNPAVNEFGFNDYLAATGLVIEGKSEIMKDLGLSAYNINAFLTLDAKKSELNIELTIDGKYDEGILGQLLRIAMDCSANYNNNFQNNLYRP